jgi:DNA replication protein DnaC
MSNEEMKKPEISQEEAERVLHHYSEVARQNREKSAASAGTPIQEAIRPTMSQLAANLPGALKSHDEERRAADADYQQRTRERQARIAQKMHPKRCQSCWQDSGVPERYFCADLNDLGDVPPEYTKLADRLRTLLSRPGLYAVVGEKGPGKTHLACATIREFCRHEKGAKYFKLLDLYRLVKSTWGKQSEESERDVMGDLARLPLLVIDEADKRNDSPWEATLVEDLIDTRYSKYKTTLLIANSKPEALAEKLGEAVISRLQETGHIWPAEWPSMRETAPRPLPETPIRYRPDGTPIFPPVKEGCEPIVNPKTYWTYIDE